MEGKSSGRRPPSATGVALLLAVFLLVVIAPAVFAPAVFAQPVASTNETAAGVPAFRSGLLVMPYAGANLAMGDTAKAFNLGYRVGGIGGWHVSPFLSLNGELTFDRLDPVDVENGYVLKATATDLAFSPLVHVALDRGDLVIGPKFGVFRFATSLSIDWTGNPPKDETDHGFAYGLNLGVFGSVGDLAVGVLLGWTVRHGTERCPTRQSEAAYCPRGKSELKLLTAAVAVLY